MISQLDKEISKNLKEIITNKAQNKNPEDIEKIVTATSQLYYQHRDLKGKKVMILFSGGLDTSFLTHFLQHIVAANSVTFFANVGSVTAPLNPKEIAARAKELKASNHAWLDCRKYLAQLALNAINSEATLGNFGHHPASSLSRVAICEGAVKYAKKHRIFALIHGSNGSQNNPYRFMSALNHFKKLYNHQIEEFAPNLGSKGVSRHMEALYLNVMGIRLNSKSVEKNISHDRSLLGDEWEEDFLSNPANSFDIRNSALAETDAAHSKIKIGLRFQNGIPSAINLGDCGFIEKDILTILEDLNAIGLKYRLGIYDYPEHRPIGINAREIHIGPAMDILIKSRNWLRGYTLNRQTNIAHDHLSKAWSDLVLQQNFYLTPEREKIDTLLREASSGVNGDVTLTLENGLISNLTSPHAEIFIEGKIAAANTDFVRSHVQKGPDNFTQEIIKICEKQLRRNLH